MAIVTKGRLRCSRPPQLLVSVNEHFLFPQSSHSLLSIRLAQACFTTHGVDLLSFTFPKITRISNSCSAASVGVGKTCWSPILVYANELSERAGPEKIWFRRCAVFLAHGGLLMGDPCTPPGLWKPPQHLINRSRRGCRHKHWEDGGHRFSAISNGEEKKKSLLRWLHPFFMKQNPQGRASFKLDSLE